MPRKQINRKIDFKSIDSNLMAALLTPARDIGHFDLWLRKFLSVELASQVVSRFANIAPLQLAWKIYNHATAPKGTYQSTLDILATASRGSQKTLMCAVVECAILLHDRRSFIHYAASRGQAASGFQYVKTFLTNDYLKIFLDGKPTKERIVLRIPNYQDLDDIKICTADVLPISTFNVESKHVAMLGIDELSSLDNSKLSAYRYLSGIPISTDESKPPIILQISSRKTQGTLIEELIEKAPESGLSVQSWTSLEMMQNCGIEKHGEEKFKYYGSPYALKVITPEEYTNLEDKEKVHYFEADGFKHCFKKCEIAHSCLSQAAKQTCTIKTLNSVEKVISDFKREPQLWTAQRMSLEATKEGAIYSGFSVERHVKTEREILKLLEAPENTNDLISYIRKQGYLRVSGVDHSGGAAEGTVSMGIVDEKGKIYWIDYFAKEGLDTEGVIVKLREFEAKYGIDVVFPDPSPVDKNTQLERAGFVIQADLRKSVISGIDQVRSYLLNYKGETAMFFLKGKTDQLALDMLKYRFKSKIENIYSDEPSEANSHGPDNIRYVVQNIAERHYRGVKITVDDEQKSNKIENMSDVRRSLNDAFKKHLNKLGVETDNEEKIESVGGIKYIL